MPHVRICAAGGEQSSSLPRPNHRQPLLVEDLAAQDKAELRIFHHLIRKRGEIELHDVATVRQVRYQLFSRLTEGISSQPLIRGNPCGISAIRSASL